MQITGIGLKKPEGTDVVNIPGTWTAWTEIRRTCLIRQITVSNNAGFIDLSDIDLTPYNASIATVQGLWGELWIRNVALDKSGKRLGMSVNTSQTLTFDVGILLF